jgi:ribosomal-protein-serine acetyltransferase
MLSIPSRSLLRRTPLITKRLLLTPVEPPDGPDLWEAVAGSREHLQRWLPWVPYNDSAEANQRYVDACASDWDLGRALRFSIRATDDRRLLGIVGLDNCVHLHRSCELGYWLRRDVCGQGLMTEAAGACIGFAFARLGAHRIRCAAATDNHPSLGVIGRLGFRFEGIARQAEFVDARWVDHAVFARLASDR